MEISLTGTDTHRAWHDVAVLYFQFVVVAAVFGGVAWVAAGRGGGISDPAPDRPDVALPDDRQLGKPDIDAARFTVGWRGYRMDEVDRVLDRLAAEIDYRDRLLADLIGPTAVGYDGSSATYQPVARSGGAGSAAGTTQTAVALPGDTAPEPSVPESTYPDHPALSRPATDAPETTDPEQAATPGQPGTETDPAESPYDENPLSTWYRRREPPA